MSALPSASVASVLAFLALASAFTAVLVVSSSALASTLASEAMAFAVLLSALASAFTTAGADAAGAGVCANALEAKRPAISVARSLFMTSFKSLEKPDRTQSAVCQQRGPPCVVDLLSGALVVHVSST